jgi:AcrR family transcriptional regulator
MPGRRSDAEALETRSTILREAADIASVEGLEGVTIGRLAADLQMSKSGVIGHFGTKEELQLATLGYAADVFRRRVWEPAEHLQPGLPRLLGVCESWTRYAEKPVFSGGCFIAHVSYEFDSREGRVHDELARVTRRWHKALIADIERAVDEGDLPADTDPEQVAFSLDALAAGMNPAKHLLRQGNAAAWTMRAMKAVLRLPDV